MLFSKTGKQASESTEKYLINVMHEGDERKNALMLMLAKKTVSVNPGQNRGFKLAQKCIFNYLQKYKYKNLY